jgi:small subunit ribosomal protein S17
MKNVIGEVTSNKMQKTVVVEEVRLVAHPMYSKRTRRTTRYHAHDELGVKIGDVVELVECKPMSKTKTWKVKGVIKSYGTT